MLFFPPFHGVDVLKVHNLLELFLLFLFYLLLLELNEKVIHIQLKFMLSGLLIPKKKEDIIIISLEIF